jgi:hypothetical protein
VRTWNVELTTRRGSGLTFAVAGYVADEPPEAGQTIDVGGSPAVVEEVTTGTDGEPLIRAVRDVEAE